MPALQAGILRRRNRIFSHISDVVVTGTSWTKPVATSVPAIARRHVISLVLAPISAGAIFLTMFRVTGSWLPGLTAVAVLLSTPVFLGLSCIDPKDGPLAAGMTIFSCGCTLFLLALREMPDIGHSRGPWGICILAGLTIFIGTVLAFGTRAGSAALLAVEAGVRLFHVCLLFQIEQKKGDYSRHNLWQRRTGRRSPGRSCAIRLREKRQSSGSLRA